MLTDTDSLAECLEDVGVSLSEAQVLAEPINSRIGGLHPSAKGHLHKWNANGNEGHVRVCFAAGPVHTAPCVTPPHWGRIRRRPRQGAR